MVAGALLLIGWLVYVARGALPPFFLGAIFVIAFGPAVDRVANGFPFRRSHPDLALSCAVALLYLTFISVVLSLALAWGPEIFNEGKSFANDLPSLATRAQHEVQDSNGWYQQHIPPDVRDQLEKNVDKLAGKAGDYAQQVASRTINFATAGLTTVISYIVVPFWAFYLLKDREKATRAFIALFPERVQPDVQYLVANARAVFGSYVRAQLLLSLLTAVVTAIGLRWFGVRFSLALGIVAGIANLIPVIGPMLGGVPALIVVTATHPGLRVLWVFLFLFVTQELKDFIVVPRIQGRAVRLHPAIILVLIVLGGRLAGFWGLLLVVPVAAVLRDSYVYVYHRLGDQPALVLPDQGEPRAITPLDHDPPARASGR